MRLVKKMELDKNLAEEEPNALWSEDTAVDSDDVEEIVRYEDDPPPTSTQEPRNVAQIYSTCYSTSIEY